MTLPACLSETPCKSDKEGSEKDDNDDDGQ